MQPPTKYLEFALWKLNRAFRALGFVLVISFDKAGAEDTTIHFAGKREYDKWCEYCKKRKQ